MEWSKQTMQFTPFGFGYKNLTTADSVELLGGKGAGLLWLASEGVPVPPGFVIPTSVWEEYDKKPKSTMKLIAKALPDYLKALEGHFGYLPLLSVRSGARVSCPGMMDTILNVGIEDSNVTEWVNRLGAEAFADSFRRLVWMYGSVVHGLRKEQMGYPDGNLKIALDAYQAHTGESFPNAKAQLLAAIEAVFKSWDNERADIYRKDHGYDRAWGTAVTVQAMVFGNLNDKSGTGVLFTRNPATGGSLVTGEFKVRAQGEDIVAGAVTPKSLDEMKEWNPTLHDELLKQVIALENMKKDMLDIEFTVQDGKLYLLQVRTGKRSATAALKIAVDMMKQGLIDPMTAVKRVSVKQFDTAQLASIDPTWTKDAAYMGIPACNGVVTGKPVFTKEDAINCKEPCILVRHETTPDDIAGMKVAKGVVTMVGGMTSHAAVVVRAMDKACIVGVGAELDAFKDVEVLSIDGATGRIWTEAVPIVGGQTNGVVEDYKTLVTEVLGIVPIIFDVPTHPMDQALLYLGDKMLDPVKATQTILLTLTYVNRLYLDLMPTESEAQFMKLLAAYNPVGKVLGILHTALPKEHDLFNRLVLIAEAHHPVKFERIVPGTDLRSIVMSDKEVTLNGVDPADPAIKKVLAWKKAEGFSVVSLGDVSEGCKVHAFNSASLASLGGVIMALSIGVGVGSRIDIGGHLLVVKALVQPNVVVVTVDRGEEIVISEGKSVEILPDVKVQAGVGGNRLAFHAPKSIRISRIETQKGERR